MRGYSFAAWTSVSPPWRPQPDIPSEPLAPRTPPNAGTSLPPSRVNALPVFPQLTLRREVAVERRFTDAQLLA
jgi:hypothetical protein